ncbi:Nitrilase/cyanide hydratase and apolipoprotein N-acyltransferase [Thermosinus carboxydivorans Nor1]|uniref:Nitrilase/cyanide hydratase and apolipoprotein N-acyltransferase n=1 Tax=Thermosinus carboxydivorans Nor1 TaxID=401526 RepID=A1HPP3_9FIRM|nr:carbon-nitrogen family hydrolase [Thermosinus carboxydivorans]EAX48013.1 Nitrilase/cyanide hydratase and apolipoprotein N-acyltransferase [Thermosinus carboxydivorans Nor1]
MKVALLQMDIVLGDVEANRQKALAMLEQGAKAGAKLFVLPELWTTGYVLDQLLKIGEPDGGPTVKMLQQFAKDNGVEIVGGSIAEIRDGKVYNTIYVIDSAGEVVGKYSKIHLVPMMDEEKYLTPGDRQGLFDLSFGKAGGIVCYDLRFTELTRALALKGAEVLFIPAEWPAIRGRHWLILSQARAIENQMFVVAVNRVGRDHNNTFFGHSLVVSPWGEVLAEGSETEEQVIIADIDLGMVPEIRRKVPVFADRRPQYY